MIVFAKKNPFMVFFTLYMMKYSIYIKKINYTLYSRLFLKIVWNFITLQEKFFPCSEKTRSKKFAEMLQKKCCFASDTLFLYLIKKSAKEKIREQNSHRETFLSVVYQILPNILSWFLSLLSCTLMAPGDSLNIVKN
jgi:hypothetical protein